MFNCLAVPNFKIEKKEQEKKNKNRCETRKVECVEKLADFCIEEKLRRTIQKFLIRT